MIYPSSYSSKSPSSDSARVRPLSPNPVPPSEGHASFPDINEIMGTNKSSQARHVFLICRAFQKAVYQGSCSRTAMSFLNRFTHFKLRSLRTRSDVKPRNSHNSLPAEHEPRQHSAVLKQKARRKTPRHLSYRA